LDGVASGQEQWGDFLTAMGIFDPKSVLRGRKRVRLESDPKEAVKNADLLSESVFEKLELKRQIHRQFDELCPPGTILTTNTSTYMVSEIEDVVRRGDRFAAMHFHLGTLLVDVVPGPRTSAETLDIITRFVSSMTCVPFTAAKENRGYVFNNLSMGLNCAATALVAEYQENFEDIDRSWVTFHNAFIGPFGWLDQKGIDVFLEEIESETRDVSFSKYDRDLVRRYLDPYIKKGQTGTRSGKGFYTYPKPIYEAADFLVNPFQAPGLT